MNPVAGRVLTLALLATALSALKLASGPGVPFVLAAGIYCPGWLFSAAGGLALGVWSVSALRARGATRALASTALLLNLSVVYAFTLWRFLFHL